MKRIRPDLGGAVIRIRKANRVVFFNHIRKDLAAALHHLIPAARHEARLPGLVEVRVPEIQHISTAPDCRHNNSILLVKIGGPVKVEPTNVTRVAQRRRLLMHRLPPVLPRLVRHPVAGRDAKFSRGPLRSPVSNMELHTTRLDGLRKANRHPVPRV